MIEERKSKLLTGILIDHKIQTSLALNEHHLQCGDQIEVRVMGYWIPGSLQQDTSGWYLLTQDHVGIRLRSGLTARSCDIYSPASQKAV
jgi:hypothetical protein